MRWNFSHNIPSGHSRPVGARVLRTLALFCAMLGSGVAHSQINDTEGVWQGSLSCGELQTAGGRSPKAFVNQIEVTASLGAMTGRRETAGVIESFNGSIERSGSASLEGNGHWKDDPRRSWRYRLKGNQSGAQMTLTGPLESHDGKTRLRDCQLKLTSPALERKDAKERKNRATVPRPAPSAPAVAPVSPGMTTKPAPAAGPAARSNENLKQDKELAARQAAEKALEAERASAAKRQSDEAAAASAAARAHAAELEVLRRKNLQLDAEKVAAERAAADKAAAEKATAERATAEKAAAEKAAADKAAADKAARQKADAEAKKAPIKVRSAMDL